MQTCRNFRHETKRTLKDLALTIIKFQWFQKETEKFTEINEVSANVVYDQIHFAGLLELF